MENSESLLELAYRYFIREGFKVDFNVTVKSEDGKKQNVDLVVTNSVGEQTGILVVNWGRSIGVNVLRKLNGIVQGQNNLKKGLLVGGSFSEHSRTFAKDYNIQLLSRSKLKFNMNEP
ncbi:MAG: restriction endonuclease [Candidatus Helarchaeota archaeon]